MRIDKRVTLAAVTFLAALLIFVGLIQAGGFLVVTSTGIAYRWLPGAPVPYNPDLGFLGNLNNQEAVALIAANIEVWSTSNIPTSSLSFTNAGSLPINVTTVAQYNQYVGQADGISPVIFDADGTLFENLGFGPGTIGFAGPEFLTSSAPFYIQEARGAFNGKWIDGNPSNGELAPEDFAGTIAHEFGHYLNLDHNQINGQYYITSGTPDRSDPGFLVYGAPPRESVELMFPFVVQGASVVPSKDDAQTISTLYPIPAIFPGTFGSIRGHIFESDGTTQFQGANIVVRNVDDPFEDAVSNVSGDLFRPFFSIPAGGMPDANLAGQYRVNGLTPGASYTVELTEVQPFFSAGSSLGPLDPPAVLPGSEEFWNDTNESASITDVPIDNVPITVAAGITDNIDLILNQAPFTITLDRHQDDIGFIAGVQSLTTNFDMPNGDNDYVAVRLSLPVGVAAPFNITRATFFNNDDLTIWPKVIITTPNGQNQPDLNNPIAEFANVRGPELSDAMVPVTGIGETIADLFVVIQFPPGEAISTAGNGGGPAIGGDGDLGVGFRRYIPGNLVSTDGSNFVETITTVGSGSIDALNWAVTLDIAPENFQPDPGEPNNTPNSATAINFDQLVKGDIDPVGDVDFFTFSGSADDTVVVSLLASRFNSFLDGMLTLMTSAGDTLSFNDDSGEDQFDPIVQAVLPADGDYTIILENFDEEGGVDYFYEFTLRHYSPPFEPDNGVAQATPIVPETRFAAAMDFAGDIDFFSFDGAADEVVTVQLILEASFLDPMITLFDTDGSTALIAENDSEIQFRLPSDGTYFLAVTDIDGNGGAGHFYGISALVSPPNLRGPVDLVATGSKDAVQLSWSVQGNEESEPNNAPEDAQEIRGASPFVLLGSAEVNDRSAGMIQINFSNGSSDVLEDLYTIEILSPGLQISLTELASDLDIYLINTAITTIIASSNLAGFVDERINQPTLPAGTYLLAVTIDDAANPTESAYTLTVTGALPADEGAVLESFNIYRSETSGAVSSGEVVGTVPASTTTFTDSDLPANTFFYQVTALYDFGESPPSNEASAVVTSVADNSDITLPRNYALDQNYPNPFNPSTVIRYGLPARHANQDVTLEVYNMLGQRVRSLVHEQQPAGEYTVAWDGKDEGGKAVTSGLYIYRLKAGSFLQVRKMLFIK